LLLKLEVVEINVGDVFMLDFAEAITQIQPGNLKGKIVDVLEKRYKLGDKIIRSKSGYWSVRRILNKVFNPCFLLL
jgi:molecular chaperone GrpE (heat shock protein)